VTKQDFESTTAVLARRAPGLAWLPAVFRKHLTPAALWSAIVALAVAIGYVVNAQRDIHRHQESIAELQTSRQQDRELLQKIDTEIAVMDSKIGDIATEVDRQREWRERIESVAEESPPHARHRR
jgi:septal ring factor EnvC (AmiA/AmiB activator)